MRYTKKEKEELRKIFMEWLCTLEEDRDKLPTHVVYYVERSGFKKSISKKYDNFHFYKEAEDLWDECIKTLKAVNVL